MKIIGNHLHMEIYSSNFGHVIRVYSRCKKSHSHAMATCHSLAGDMSILSSKVNSNIKQLLPTVLSGFLEILACHLPSDANRTPRAWENQRYLFIVVFSTVVNKKSIEPPRFATIFSGNLT